MKCSDITGALGCEPLVMWNQNLVNKEYSYGFATDLMSDALALITSNSDKTVLLTGLSNAQSLRTAEMLDIEVIIYVRGKKLNETDLALAKEMGFNVYTTACSMYEACGILYAAGLKPAQR